MAFNIGFYAYAIIGHTRADYLLPQLLMEQSDTFPIQCKHIEHMHEGVWFSKLRSAGLNYNLPSFFTDSYCAGGI